MKKIDIRTELKYIEDSLHTLGEVILVDKKNKMAIHVEDEKDNYAFSFYPLNIINATNLSTNGMPYGSHIDVGVIETNDPKEAIEHIKQYQEYLASSLKLT